MISSIIQYQLEHNVKYTGETDDLRLGPKFITLEQLVLVGLHRAHASDVRWHLDLACDCK